MALPPPPPPPPGGTKVADAPEVKPSSGRIPKPAASSFANASGQSPFGPPSMNDTIVEPEEMKDADVIHLFTQYLRPDQRTPEIMRFILNYVKCRNNSQAARESGLPPSKGTYYRQRPEIHACIDAITARAVIKYGYDAEEVIERAKEIANVDPIVLQNPDGSYKKSLHEIPAEARRAIKSLKVKNVYGEDVNGIRTVVGEIIEVQFHDKMKGLELIGPEKNVFKKTTVVQHDVTSNMKSVLLESGNRAEERIRLLQAREVKDAEVTQSEAGDSDSDDGGREPTDDGISIGESGVDSTGD